MASGTLKNIPESKKIIWDIMRSVSTMKRQGQKHKIDSDDLNQLSMDDLRARLALLGEDFDGSKESLISRSRGRMKFILHVFASSEQCGLMCMLW